MSIQLSSVTVPSALVALAVTTAVGRIFLALLPPGLPGRHGWSALPITLATSYLLGSIAIDVETNILAALDFDARPWMLASPWLAIALGRWITLPGALVPRHEPACEPVGIGAHVLRWISVIVVAIAAWNGREPLFGALSADSARDLHSGIRSIADVLALVCVCAYGLERARRAPLERALVIAIFAGLLASEGFGASGPLELRATLCFGAGAAFAIPWLRRADRRAALLSVLAFAGASLHSMLGAILGLIGLVWLCVCTPRPSRKLVITAGTVAFVICFAFHGRSEPGAGLGPIESWSTGDLRTRAMRFALIAVVFASTWMLAAWMHWRQRRRAGAPAGDDVDVARVQPLFDRETEFLSELGFSALIAVLAYGKATRAFAAIDATLLFAPLLLLSIGTELVRADSNAERA